MYNHSFVLSKTNEKQGIKSPEYCKDYYELLTEIFEYVRDSYDNKVCRQANLDRLKAELFDCRGKYEHKLNQIISRNHLKEKGYKYQKHTSKKHPLLLSKCVITHKFIDNKGEPQKEVYVDSYEGTINYFNK